MFQDTERSRKNPKQARSRDTVEAILQATAQIILSDGERGVTTNHIARRAGFSIGTVYQYFANKDAILIALLERQRRQMHERVVATLVEQPGDSFESRVRRVVHLLIDSFAQGRHARSLLPRLIVRMSLSRAKGGLTGVPTEPIVEAWLQSGEPGVRPLSDCEYFVLTRSVLGVLRQAVIDDSELLARQEFAETLVWLIMGFLRGTTDGTRRERGFDAVTA